MASGIAGYFIGLGVGGGVATITGLVATSLKTGGVWVVLPAASLGLIAVGLSLVAVEVWLYPWLSIRRERDPLKRLADETDELANRIIATRDRLAADTAAHAGPMPALRAFENELGPPLHNMYHELASKNLVTAAERPVFYNHDNLETWKLATQRLRGVALGARNRAYGTDPLVLSRRARRQLRR